jgi:hypothetical protein
LEPKNGLKNMYQHLACILNCQIFFLFSYNLKSEEEKRDTEEALQKNLMCENKRLLSVKSRFYATICAIVKRALVGPPDREGIGKTRDMLEHVGAIRGTRTIACPMGERLKIIYAN